MLKKELLIFSNVIIFNYFSLLICSTQTLHIKMVEFVLLNSVVDGENGRIGVISFLYEEVVENLLISNTVYIEIGIPNSRS